jgi:hypothetical protein
VALRRLFPLAASLLVLLFEPLARAASSGPEVVIEINAKADGWLDARLTRRLIGLELREVEVPPTPVLPEPERRSMFVRVLVDSGHRLRVELWELGVFHGSRTITATPGGSRYLRAQRIALVAAELARRLRQERLRQLREQERTRNASVAALPATEAAFPRPRVLFNALGRGALVGPGDLGLGGPSLGGELMVLGRASLEVSAAWLFGSAFDLPGSSGIEWLELSISPSYSIPLNKRFGLRAGLRAAAASVHFPGISAVDRISGAHDTWSARVAAEIGAEYAWTRHVRVRGGPEFGTLLRRLPVTDRAGLDHSLGGYWLGLSIGITFDPGTRLPAHPAPTTPAPARHGTGSKNAPLLGSAAAHPPTRAGTHGLSPRSRALRPIWPPAISTREAPRAP